MADHYTLLDHTADLAIQIRGADLKSLFENAGMALMHLMIAGSTIARPTSTEISVRGQDLTDLMVRWLGEILYLFSGDSRVVTSIHIQVIRPEGLTALVEAVPFDARSHEVQTDVKAVTYYQAEVARMDDHWLARIVFDI